MDPQGDDVCVMMGNGFTGFYGGHMVTLLRGLGWIDANTTSASLRVYIQNAFVPGDAIAQLEFKVSLEHGGNVDTSTRLSTALPIWARSGLGYSEGEETTRQFVYYGVCLLVVDLAWFTGSQARSHWQAQRTGEFLRQQWFWVLVDFMLIAAACSFAFSIASRDAMTYTGDGASGRLDPGQPLGVMITKYLSCSGMAGAAYGYASEEACDPFYSEYRATYTNRAIENVGGQVNCTHQQPSTVSLC
jgi:hypothetical protein